MSSEIIESYVEDLDGLLAQMQQLRGVPSLSCWLCPLRKGEFRSPPFPLWFLELEESKKVSEMEAVVSEAEDTVRVCLCVYMHLLDPVLPCFSHMSLSTVQIAQLRLEQHNLRGAAKTQCKDKIAKYEAKISQHKKWALLGGRDPSEVVDASAAGDDAATMEEKEVGMCSVSFFCYLPVPSVPVLPPFSLSLFLSLPFPL